LDLVKKKVRVVDFFIGKNRIRGDFLYSLKREKVYSEVLLEGNDIVVGERKIPWVKSKIIKKRDVLLISYLSSPEFTIKGKINLNTEEIVLDIEVNFQGRSFLEGKAKLKAKVWGKLSDLMSSGTLTVDKGKYYDKEFAYLSLNFLGKIPLLNLMDSKVVLKDGSSYDIEGTIDLRKMDDALALTEFISKNITFGEWEVLSEEDKNIGLRKDVDEKFDILFNTYDDKYDYMDTGAELRYKVEKNQFLRLRMEGERTIIGFEKRKQF
jgi:hypothetical protein